MLGLDAHDATTPLPPGLSIVIEHALEAAHELIELVLVLLPDTSDGNARGSLLVHKSTKARLAFDDAIWHILLAAQGWHPANHLHWVNIVGNDDKLGLLLFNECGDMVEAKLQNHRLLWLHLTTILLCIRCLQQARRLLLSGLWLVLLAQLEQASRLVLVDGVCELVDGRWHLQAQEHNALLALQANVLRPLHKAVEVSLWSDVTADPQVLWVLLEENALLHLLLFLSKGRSGRLLLGLCFGCCLLTHGCLLFEALSQQLLEI
mmetsp:Transcript_43396/g.97732  ORF Transcript_43396/g.97732 Transcript_43396/m.97732 type:complete len:263 (-) Transcript_43396:38-826(-)